MACCGKRRRKQRLMEMDFLKNSLGLMKAMKDADLARLADSVLLDYHRKCHMLYAGNMKYNPPNKAFINSVVTLHNKIVKEMERRKMKHNTPLQKI